jgi:hypothetical protein
MVGDAQGAHAEKINQTPHADDVEIRMEQMPVATIL